MKSCIAQVFSGSQFLHEMNINILEGMFLSLHPQSDIACASESFISGYVGRLAALRSDPSQNQLGSAQRTRQSSLTRLHNHNVIYIKWAFESCSRNHCLFYAIWLLYLRSGC